MFLSSYPIIPSIKKIKIKSYVNVQIRNQHLAVVERGLRINLLASYKVCRSQLRYKKMC